MQKSIFLATAATSLLCLGFHQPVSATALDDVAPSHARGEDAANFARLQPLAASGNAQAQYQLGVMYARGWGVPQDHAKAAILYQQSASQNFALGEGALASAYQNGWGVPRDWAQANMWMTKSANDGNPIAQSNLGTLYAMGVGGLPKDPVQAYFWFAVAQSLGANTESGLHQLAASMTPAQIADAKGLATDWQAKHPVSPAPANRTASADDKKAVAAMFSNMATPPMTIVPDAQQIEAAKHVLAAIGLTYDMLKRVEDIRWDVEKKPFLADAAKLQPPKSSQAADIVARAAADNEEKAIRANIDSAVDYFASHASKESMNDYTGWWNSPEVQKTIQPSHVPTPEEREARGKALLAYPKATQMLGAEMEFAKVRLASAVSTAQAQKAVFRSRVCADLQNASITIPSCPAPVK